MSVYFRSKIEFEEFRFGKVTHFCNLRIEKPRHFVFKFYSFLLKTEFSICSSIMKGKDYSTN